MRPPLLEIAGLNKTFGKSRVLSHISFSVGEAEVVGFVGPNGAGKTTTMKIMCGLLRADSGTVSLAGFDVARQRRDFLLDEPMNGLDPTGMVKLREFIRSLCRDRGISVFISSHLLHEVEQVCDRVLFIREGRLLEHAEVSADRLAEIAAVYLRTGDDAAACALLRAQPFIQEVNPLDRGIECRLPAECVPRLAELLVAARIPLCELGPRRTSLEQVYLTHYPEGGSQPIQ